MSTKENIVKTALQLFLQNGYEKTSLNHIAREVGITKPAIYHHFKNKDEWDYLLYQLDIPEDKRLDIDSV